MAAALSVTHGFLPPHPAPTAVAVAYNADPGLTLLYGSILAVPVAVLAGPCFARLLKGMKTGSPPHFQPPVLLPDSEVPGLGASLFTGLVPVLLLALSVVAGLILPKTSLLRQVLNLVGDPMETVISVAGLLAVLALQTVL